MKLLENKEEVILAISKSNIEKPHSLTSTKYHDSVYLNVVVMKIIE